MNCTHWAVITYNNVIFDSKSGSMYISGFTQSTAMAHISGGTNIFSANTDNSTNQIITLSENPLSVDQTTLINSFKGVILHQNVTSSAGTAPSHLDLLMEIYHLIHPMFMLRPLEIMEMCN